MRRGVVLAGAIGTVALALIVPGFRFDFNLDWITSRAFILGIDPHQPINVLADELGLSGRLTFMHPRLPGALILQSPFGLIPFEWMYAAGRMITAAAAIWLGWLASKWSRVPPIWIFAFLPLVFVVWPFSSAMKVSQWSALIVAVLIGLALNARDGWLAGVPLGIAVTLKMWPWLIVAALWMAGRRKTSVGAGVAFLFLNVLGLATPQISVAGTLASMASAASLTSASPSSKLGLPVWASVAVGLGILWAVHRFLPKHSLRLSVPIALLTAPMMWTAYLSALLVLLIKPPTFAAETDARSLDSSEKRHDFHGIAPTGLSVRYKASRID